MNRSRLFGRRTRSDPISVARGIEPDADAAEADVDLVLLEVAPSREDVDPTMIEAERHAAERARLQTDAVGGSFWITVSVLLGLPLAAVSNAVIAHQLGARSYGTLAIYTLVFGVATALINAGISDATVQWIATHQARDERSEVTDAIRRCSGFHLLIEAPLFAVLAGVLLRDAGVATMAVGAASAAAIEIVGTGTVVMSGAGLNALGARISLAATVAGQTAIIAVAAQSPVASSVFVGRLALGLVGPVLALFLIPQVFRSAVLRPLLPRRWPAGFLPFALRTCASGVVASLVFGRPELLLFDAYGHGEQAGLFALATGVAGLITAPIDSLLGPLLPAAAGLLAMSPGRAGSALLRGLRTSTMLAGLVAALGIPLVAPLLPSIYGGSFSDAKVAFVTLATVSCIQSVNHPVQAFLMGSRRTGLLLRVALVSLVVDAAVAAIAIPLLGVMGGVLASSVAQLGTLVVVARRIGALLGLSVTDQLGAVSYFVDATIAGAAAMAVEYATDRLPAVVVAALGTSTGLVAIGVLGRLRPSSGLFHADEEVIHRGLPGPLRPLFRHTITVLGLRSQVAQ